MNKQNYEFSVLINGRPAKEYYKDEKSFVEGREGTQYTLRLRNNSWKKILAVFSVDSIEVIEGKVASEFKGGYILDPYSSIEIKGYRIDEESVAAFRFAKTHKSYSNVIGGASLNEKTGDTVYKKTTRNNGVIGVRIFEEKPKPKPILLPAIDIQYPFGTRFFYNTVGLSVGPSPVNGGILKSYDQHEVLPYHVIYATGCCAALGNITSTNCKDTFDDTTVHTSLIRSQVNQLGQLSATPSQIIQAPNFNLGTTWGETVYDKVKEIKFDSVEEYVDLEIYYDSRESLIGFGIDFEATKQYAAWPAAFSEKKKFCKVPANYKG